MEMAQTELAGHGRGGMFVVAGEHMPFMDAISASFRDDLFDMRTELILV